MAGARKYVAQPDNRTSVAVFSALLRESFDDKRPVVDITQADSPMVGVMDAEMNDAVAVVKTRIGMVNARRVRFKKETQ